MKCNCGKDLGAQFTITAIEGKLMCNDCATENYTREDLFELGEEISPQDVDIDPESCKWCGEEKPIELFKTDLGWICGWCIMGIRSHGEQVLEYGEVHYCV